MVFSIDELSVELAYILIGAVVGIIVMSISSIVIPKLLNKMSRKIDEEHELVRGNLAVATYYGQIIHAVIIGISIIVAAAIIAAIL